MAKSLLKRGQGGCGSRKQGLGQSRGGRARDGKRYRIIVLRRLVAGTLALPLRKFQQTKIYTDTTVSTASSLLLSVPQSFSLLPRRACETASSKREAMSTAHLNIPRFHKNVTFLENLETRIHHEPLDPRRKSTSITTDPMRSSVDACFCRIRSHSHYLCIVVKTNLTVNVCRHDSWIRRMS